MYVGLLTDTTLKIKRLSSKGVDENELNGYSEILVKMQEVLRELEKQEKDLKEISEISYEMGKIELFDNFHELKNQVSKEIWSIEDVIRQLKKIQNN